MRWASGTDSWAVGLALTLLPACSRAPQASPRDVADANDTGRALAATSQSEREILRQVPALREGSPLRVGDATVVADAVYASASGRTCRALHVADAVGRTRDRLVCSDGVRWFFVPDVFIGKAVE